MPKEKIVVLNEEEKKTFGNRCPHGYQKVRVLGKGGVAVVWLGVRNERMYAMKQFPKQKGNNCDNSAQVEQQIQAIIMRNSSEQGKALSF